MRLPTAHTFLGACLLLTVSSAWSQESLHDRIDQLIEAKAGGPLAALSTDAEFHRRVYLDLAGRSPSVEETRAFLAEAETDKREKLIDRLLASEDHARRFSQVLHVMLMERLGDHEEWQKFLRSSVKANKPCDQLVREIVNPDANNEQTRGSALWYSKRLENYGQNPVDLPALVRDVGRHFLGIDVQCAQCHDHLFVDDYKQEHYAGLFAYVGHATLRTDLKFPAVTLRPLDKKVDFMSVFVREPKAVGPKLPGGEEVAIPVLAENEKFEQPPDPSKGIPGIPKFNTLKILSEQLPRAENNLFTRNIANRLWWLMLGRGLVQPLDLHHAGNPASHPELLDLLSKELAAHQFDMRWLLRELALSRTYQRSSFAMDESLVSASPESFRLALEKPLSSEQMLASLRQALGGPKPLAIPDGDKGWTEWQTRFDKALANPPREPEVEHSPSVKAALFLMNDSEILKWLKPEGDNLTARLAGMQDAAQLAEELYLAVLARTAAGEEKQAVAEHLAARLDGREVAIRNLVWALIASNEFGANH
jgi:hypothetical protein